MLIDAPAEIKKLPLIIYFSAHDAFHALGIFKIKRKNIFILTSVSSTYEKCTCHIRNFFEKKNLPDTSSS
jgi:hypothetical protein